MIAELIVVEGIHDISAVLAAVDAEMIATQGFALGPDVQERIRRASRGAGVIVFTDPDPAGERIRRRVADLAPNCRHAYLPRDQAMRGRNIGVENADVDAIRAALAGARPTTIKPSRLFTMDDLLVHGLTGVAQSRARREQVGHALSLGYCNARQLLRRLNHYGVTRAEFDVAVAAEAST